MFCKSGLMAGGLGLFDEIIRGNPEEDRLEGETDISDSGGVYYSFKERRNCLFNKLK